MLNYKSNKGGGPTVDFEKAILDGYALDGGLYVPEYLPKVTHSDLIKWKAELQSAGIRSIIIVY